MSRRQHPAAKYPKTPAEALSQAQLLAQNQQLEQAEKLLARFPDHPDCVFRRATVLMTLERWAVAEDGFRRVLSVAPSHFDSIMGLAGALVEQGRAVEAVPLLDGAVRTKSDIRTRYCRAIALDEAGRPDEAARDLSLARSMLIGQIESRDLIPLEVYAQISRRCNLRCAMCGHQVWQSNSGFMEDAVFDRIVAQCTENSIKRLHILSGQGEPLLHPQVFDLLTRAVSQGLEVGIVTNGTPLTPERCETLAGLGLSYIQFSFAGWDKDSYESIYVGSKFERTLENLKTMTRAVQGTKTHFMVKAVCEGEDWAKVRDKTRAFLNAQGIGNVFTVTANNFGGHVTHGTLSPRHGIWTLKNLEHQRRMPCRVLLKSVGVFCDGTVTACSCYDSNAELKIGNIMDQSLAQIRQGEEFRRILDGFRRGDLQDIPMCGKCDDPFG